MNFIRHIKLEQNSIKTGIKLSFFFIMKKNMILIMLMKILFIFY